MTACRGAPRVLSPFGIFSLWLSPSISAATDLSPGTEIIIGGERRTVKSAGTAATAPTKVFINVSTGPWLDFPAGTPNLPVHSAEGCDARREAHFYRV